MTVKATPVISSASMAYSENGSVLPVGASEVVAALTCGPEPVELEELPLPLPPEVRAGFTPDPESDRRDPLHSWTGRTSRK